MAIPIRTYNEHLKARVGEKRVVRKFLFVPRWYDSFRWLCFSNIIEQVRCVDAPPDMLTPCRDIIYRWKEIEFAEEDEIDLDSEI